MKKLLVTLLLASSSMFCAQQDRVFALLPDEVAQIFYYSMHDAAKAEVSRISKTNTIEELDKKLKEYSSKRAEALEKCKGQEDGKVQLCNSLKTFLETMIVETVARKLELEAQQAKVAVDGAKKIENAPQED